MGARVVIGLKNWSDLKLSVLNGRKLLESSLARVKKKKKKVKPTLFSFFFIKKNQTEPLLNKLETIFISIARSLKHFFHLRRDNKEKKED